MVIILDNPVEECIPYSFFVNKENHCLFRRWGATFIDYSILFLFLAFLAYIQKEGIVSKTITWPMRFVPIFFYFTFLEGFTGYTIGKYICRIRVINQEGKPPGFSKALIRTLLRFIEVNPLFAGGIPAGIAALRSQTSQRAGDKLAKTFVIRIRDLPRNASELKG